MWLILFLNNLSKIFKVILSSRRLETSMQYFGREREVPEYVIWNTATSNRTM